MKLYTTKRSPFARKALIMAIEKGLDKNIELVFEDLTKKSDELVTKNPLGKVPLLVLNEGTAIYDSPVICEYIDSLNSSPKLIPNNIPQKIKTLTISALADGMTESAIAIFFENQKPSPDKKTIDKHINVLKNSFASLNKEDLSFTKFTMAEISVFSAISYINFRLPELKFLQENKRLKNFFDEFSKRPSAEKTTPVA
jgi:glutathione S-transferase